MRLETELDNLNIQYESEVFNGSKVIKCKNGIRVHIYKDHVTLCDNNGYYSAPPTERSLQHILEVIKSYERDTKDKK